MESSAKILNDVEICTATTRFRGNLTMPNALRLSDFVGDKGRRMITLNQVMMSKSNSQWSASDPRLDQVAIDKQNLIAVIVRAGSSTPVENAVYRIRKEPEDLVLYTPPYAFDGTVYRAPCASSFGMFESPNEDFISMTSVRMWSLDQGLLLDADIEFVAVNRRWIIAVHVRPPVGATFAVSSSALMSKPPVRTESCI